MRRIVLLVLIVLGFGSLQAQEVYTSSGHTGFHKKPKKKGYDPDKLILGGGFNAGFGGGDIILGISPIAGYRFTPAFSAGVGLGYLYYRQTYQDQYNTYYDNSNMIYPSTWARYFVYHNIYLTSVFEYDFIHYKGTTLDYLGNPVSDVQSVTAACFLVGFGVKQPLGGRVSGVFEIMYDVLQEHYSPYLNQPVIKLGIVAGL